MNDFVNKLYKNQALFYKVFLFVLTSVLIVYLLPKGGKFKYDIPKGKPWQYENLYAPFDFAILKTDEEIAAEVVEDEEKSKGSEKESQFTLCKNLCSFIFNDFTINTRLAVVFNHFINYYPFIFIKNISFCFTFILPFRL